MIKDSAFSGRSIFHGCSTFLIVIVLFLSVFGLYLLNNTQLYKGSGNNCLSKNTIAMYGEDNFLYCPNTYTIASLNITDPYFQISVVTFNSSREEMTIQETQNIVSPQLDMYVEPNEVYWYFNLNSNSSLGVNFINVKSSDLTLKVDDDDSILPDGIPLGNSSVTIYPKKYEKSKGYKVMISTSNMTDWDTTVGYVVFNISQTSFGNKPTATGGEKLTCTMGLGCYWEFIFAEKVCISIYNPAPRNWGSDNSGDCLILIPTGYDYEWTLLILGSAVIVLSFIVLVNGIVAYSATRKKPNVNIRIE